VLQCVAAMADLASEWLRCKAMVEAQALCCSTVLRCAAVFGSLWQSAVVLRCSVLQSVTVWYILL